MQQFWRMLVLAVFRHNVARLGNFVPDFCVFLLLYVLCIVLEVYYFGE